MADDPLALVVGSHAGSLGSGEQVVQLGDELLHGGDELDKALGDEHRTEVVAVLGTLGDNTGDVRHDVVERLVLGLDFLTHDAHVGLALECAFQSDVAGRAAHELDEVPVLAG